MSYAAWLAVISVAFVLVERLRPARPQPLWRPQLGNDLAYLVFNGHFWAVLTAGLSGALALRAREGLAFLPFANESTALARLPWFLQCVLFLVVSDFLQWCVHVLLHRLPWLWRFHKVHHSAHRMDWAVNFRFHWMELVVYRSLLYVPLALVGGDPSALFAVALFATAWGHFNHANLDLGIGPLGYVFNSPRMHLWHHDDSDEGGSSKNYAIVLSLWDWLFRTAYWPRERAPRRLGYSGDQEMPTSLVRQVGFGLAPSIRQRSSETS